MWLWRRVIPRQHERKGGGDTMCSNTPGATWQACRMQLVSCWFAMGFAIGECQCCHSHKCWRTQLNTSRHDITLTPRVNLAFVVQLRGDSSPSRSWHVKYRTAPLYCLCKSDQYFDSTNPIVLNQDPLFRSNRLWKIQPASQQLSFQKQSISISNQSISYQLVTTGCES